MTSTSSAAVVSSSMDTYYSTSGSPPGSPGPSNKILNRVSTLFGGGKKKNPINSNSNSNSNGASSSSSSAGGVVVQVQSSNQHQEDNDTLVNTASQVDSMFHQERNDSCVDSMYSSLQSRRSNYRPTSNNANVPAPLRTVQLDNPIVHLPTTLATPPTPPPSNSNQLSTDSKPTSASSSSTFNSPSPPPQQQEQRKSSPPPTTNTSKIEDVEKQFELLLREYAPSADHMSNVNNLTLEQKEMLLRSSRSPALLKKNSTFSHVMPSFSLKATFGIKHKSSSKYHKTTSSQDQQFFFSESSSDDTIHNGGILNGGNTTNSGIMSETQLNQLKAHHTAPAGRYGGKSRSALPHGGNSHESYGRSTSRSKLKSTPEYFVHLLRETHVRELDDAEVLDLRVFLRSVVVSWTSEFLAQGGYEAIANLFKQMKKAPKRFPNDNRMLQHLGKCLKTIMTHQSMGTQIVLTNPSALFHIRDILFGPASKKQKQVYGLDITTRSLLLNLLCTLATLQTSRTSEIEYVHGYDVLRRLLLDRPTDKLYEEEDKKNQPKHVSPFPISLKTDPKEILQMIMENDPNGKAIGEEYEWDRDELKPRYTSWMRELQYTVERHIETITFLAQVLNYDFKSAYRQIKLRQSQTEQEAAAAAASNPEASGAVMTEEGVVDYIITHLRLIRTVVTTQPTTYTGNYDEREQEKMRLELMLSGFDKISKILIQCPHPTVRSSYINYLKPLMNPCADLSVPSTSNSPPPPLPSRNNNNNQFVDGTNLSQEEEDEYDNYEISVYAEDEVDELEGVYRHDSPDNNHGLIDRQWRYEEEPYYDDIFQDEEYIEDHFNSDEDDEVSSDVSGSHHRASSSYYDDDSLYNETQQPQQEHATVKVVHLGEQQQQQQH